MQNLSTTINSMTVTALLAEGQTLPAQQIAGLMLFQEKIFLQSIAKNLPENAVIVEVGCFCGGSSAILANAAPTASITSIDIFDTEDYWFYKQKSTNILNAPRTLENVREYIKEFNNVTIISGKSPDAVLTTWNTPVDLYFEDGDHSNPGLYINVAYWSQRVKPGGYMLFHDYRQDVEEDGRLHWPDVTETVDRYRDDPNWEFLGNVFSLALFRKLS